METEHPKMTMKAYPVLGHWPHPHARVIWTRFPRSEGRDFWLPLFMTDIDLRTGERLDPPCAFRVLAADFGYHFDSRATAALVERHHRGELHSTTPEHLDWLRANMLKSADYEAPAIELVFEHRDRRGQPTDVSLPYARIRIGDEEMLALVSTGTEISTMTTALALKRFGPEAKVEIYADMHLVGIDQKFTERFEIVEDNEPIVVLGLSFLSKTVLAIKGDQGTLTVG